MFRIFPNPTLCKQRTKIAELVKNKVVLSRAALTLTIFDNIYLRFPIYAFNLRAVNVMFLRSSPPTIHRANQKHSTLDSRCLICFGAK